MMPVIGESTIILVAVLAGVDPVDSREEILSLLESGITPEGSAQALRLTRLYSEKEP